jgi:hypothetical protein
MAYPQGINFRATAGFVTDVSPDAGEYSAGADYPFTTAQGNTVGWESALADMGGDRRDRSTVPDVRLAGLHWIGADPPWTPGLDFRLDLPSAGNYDINLASGDYSYARGPNKMELLDTSTSLGVLVNAATSAAAMFLDATGVERTAAAWPGSNAAVTKTFSTAICRFRVGGGASDVSAIAHLRVSAHTSPPGPITANRAYRPRPFAPGIAR